ncbi:MAG: GIY-YIG nuclease family protein [Terriglobia bacterium]
MGKILMYYCYMLRCADGSFYVGVSDDPGHRLKEHNDGKGADWRAEPSGEAHLDRTS